MSLENCKNCNGDGIVGNGDNPHLKEGHLHNCDVCKGTGKVEIDGQASHTEPGEEKTIDTTSTQSTTETAPAEDGSEKKSEGEQSSSEGGQESVSDKVGDDSSLG